MQRPGRSGAAVGGVVWGSFCVACALFSVDVAADPGRFQDYAFGARATGLGGAYGALADDPTGVFYNPAGLADVRHPRLSVSSSLYGVELIGASPVESDLLRRGVTPADLIFVPASTGVVTGLGDPLPSGAHPWAFGFGTAVPQFTSRYTEQLPSDERGTRFISAVTDRTLHAGAALAGRAGPWLRIGAALHYALRTVDAEESLVDGGDGDGFVAASTRLRSSIQGARAVLGAKIYFGPRFTGGIALTTPTVAFWRDVRFESVEAVAGVPNRFDVVRVNDSGFRLAADVPGLLRTGVAFSEPGDFTISSDVTLHFPGGYDVIDPDALGDSGIAVARVPIPLQIELGPVANLAVGVEKHLTEQLAVSVGGFTNLSAAPALLTDDDGFLLPRSSRLSTVNMVGGSLALGLFGEHNVNRIGVTGSFGWGSLVAPAAPDERFLGGSPPLQAVQTTQTLIYVVWSSTFRFGDDGATREFGL